MALYIQNNLDSMEFLTREQILQHYNEFIGNMSDYPAQHIITLIQYYLPILTNYQERFKLAFENFQKLENIEEKSNIIQLSKNHGPQNIKASIPNIVKKKNQSQEEKALNTYINTLIEGKIILHTFREIITGQTIQEKITIKTNKGIYQVESNQIYDYITPVLSTYGSSKNNPVSLAYQFNLTQQVDSQISGIQNYLAQKAQRIDQTDIYQAIMNKKIPYLKKIKKWKNPTSRNAIFNSKDVEIYSLLSQMSESQMTAYFRPNDPEYVKTYSYLRSVMGGGHGYATPQLKGADVGLEQSKYVTQSQNTVNIIRHRLIELNIDELIATLQLTNLPEIKSRLIKQFTENPQFFSSNTIKEITGQFNMEARKEIRKLFNVQK